MGPRYFCYLGGLVGFDEGGRWVIFIHYSHLLSAKSKGVGVVIMNAIDFPRNLSIRYIKKL